MRKWSVVILLFLAVILHLSTTQTTHAFTVYATAAEDLDLNNVGSATIDTNTSHFRNAWVRSGFMLSDNGVPSSNFWIMNPRFSAASFWLSARVYLTGGIHQDFACGGEDNIWFRFADSSNFTRLYLVNSSCNTNFSSASSWRLYKTGSSGSTLLMSGFSCGFALTPATPDKLDVQVINYNLSSGTINFYVNNTLCGSYTGQLYTDSATALSGVSFGAPGFFSDNATLTWSEIMISDSDTRSLGLATLVPNGTGNSNSWTCTGSSPAASISVVVNTDSTNCNSPTSGQTQEWTVSNLPGGTWAVLGVGMSIRSADGIIGPTGIKPVVRTGGSDFLGTNQAQVLSLQNYQYFWYLNPNTSAPWTTSDVNSGGFNLGVNSQP